MKIHWIVWKTLMNVWNKNLKFTWWIHLVLKLIEIHFDSWTLFEWTIFLLYSETIQKTSWKIWKIFWFLWLFHKINFYFINNTNMKELNEYYDFLVQYWICTEDEINLVTSINWYSEETLNDILYCRTWYHDLEQYKEYEL